MGGVLAFVFGVMVSLYYAWSLTLVTIGALPIIVGLLGAAAQWQKKSNERATAASAEASAVAMEALTNVRTVAAFGAEKRESDRYRDRCALAAREALSSSVATGLNGALVAAILYGTWALGLWYGSYLIRADMAKHDECNYRVMPDGDVREPANKCTTGGNVMTAFLCVLFGGLDLLQALPDVAVGHDAVVALVVLGHVRADEVGPVPEAERPRPVEDRRDERAVEARRDGAAQGLPRRQGAPVPVAVALPLLGAKGRHGPHVRQRLHGDGRRLGARRRRPLVRLLLPLGRGAEEPHDDRQRADRHEGQAPGVVERHHDPEDEREDALEPRREFLAEAVLDRERRLQDARADGALVLAVEPRHGLAQQGLEVVLPAPPRLRRRDARRQRRLRRDRDELLHAHEGVEQREEVHEAHGLGRVVVVEGVDQVPEDDQLRRLIEAADRHRHHRHPEARQVAARRVAEKVLRPPRPDGLVDHMRLLLLQVLLGLAHAADDATGATTRRELSQEHEGARRFLWPLVDAGAELCQKLLPSPLSTLSAR